MTEAGFISCLSFKDNPMNRKFKLSDSTSLISKLVVNTYLIQKFQHCGVIPGNTTSTVFQDFIITAGIVSHLCNGFEDNTLGDLGER